MKVQLCILKNAIKYFEYNNDKLSPSHKYKQFHKKFNGKTYIYVREGNNNIIVFL